MTHISIIDIARPCRSRQVLFIGNPTSYSEVTLWATVRKWIAQQGLEPTQEIDGDTLCVIVTEDVLDGKCSPSDAVAIARARADGVPCLSVHDTRRIWDATARARAVPRRSRCQSGRLLTRSANSSQ